jgi:predicted glycogen debranching enzyme
MNFLNFDKNLLINLEKSLTKEMIRTNRAGAYCSSTLVDCNTRKYHGQLVVPLPHIDNHNHVLLSSIDETICKHGAEFNLSVHQYPNNHVFPNGHKYIREFDCNSISKTVFRVGSVIIAKERCMVFYENKVLIKYTMLETQSETILRLKPLLAFRSVHELCKENLLINNSYTEIANGISVQLYPTYPSLQIQLSKSNTYQHTPHWNKNMYYAKEAERGFECTEDLYIPGTFEVSLKQGESVIVAVGTEPSAIKTLKTLWDKEVSKRNPRTDLYNCLRNSAVQFYTRTNDNWYVLAGYPWFTVRARDQFISLPGCTVCVGETDMYEKIMQTAMIDIQNLMDKGILSANIQELDTPDALLWCIWSIQQYGIYVSEEKMMEKYGKFILSVVEYIRKQKHPNLFVHANGLLYINGKEIPATWMNAEEENLPITPRTGFVVELNALWYNALKFAATLYAVQGNNKQSHILDYQAELAGNEFIKTFWNGMYLYDYVDGINKNVEVRPNMIFATSLPYTPLSKSQQKAILDICTKELLTPKGLRSLSPKSGSYRPNYVGGMLERNRNYHNGPVWTWTFGAYAETYLRIHKKSGISFIERIIVGLEAEMKKLCIGTLSELYDGNPPFKGHGGMSFAMNVAEILRVLRLLQNIEKDE